MLIVLPPSETKAHGGTGAPLDFSTLSFPRLNPTRAEIAQTLAGLEIDTALEVLKLSEKLRGEAASNQQLFASPTMPAIDRFTGVLYDALAASTLTAAQRAHLAVGDALFGLIRADDPIPHYRLSGSTKLGGKTLKSLWGSLISEQLSEIAAQELVIDLRSGTYQQLGKCPAALTVRVESLQPDGSRKVVSHFNKHYKGELARVLAQSPDTPHTAADVMSIARAAGWQIENSSERELTLVV